MDVMDTLFHLGADPEVRDENGLTALLAAIDDQDEELVDRLLKLGASPNTCSSTGVAPLLMALSHKHRKYDTAILRRLLEAGADVNMANQVHGITPLMVACHSARRYTDAAQMLIRRGASANATDLRGRAPLHFSLRTVHNFPCLRLLLRSGASPNVVDNRGDTPLSMLGHGIEKCMKADTALENLYLKTLGELLTYGADPNTVTSRANPNKLMSVFMKLESAHVAVRALLAAGTEPVSPDSYVRDSHFEQTTPPSSSPLTYALDSGNIALARLLVDGLFYTQCDLMYLSTHCAASSDSSKTYRSIPDTSHAPSSTNSSRVVNNPHTTVSTTGETSSMSSSPVGNVPAQNSSLVSDNTEHSAAALSSTSATTETGAANSRSDVGGAGNIDEPTASTFTAADAVSHPTGNSNSTNSANGTTSDLNNARGTANAISNRRQSTQSSDDQSQYTQSSEDNQRPMTHGITSRTRSNNIRRSMSRPLALSSEYWSQVREIATEVCQNTPSLQQLCRRSVHRAMGNRQDKAASVTQLPIWAKLQRYILFQGPEYQL